MEGKTLFISNEEKKCLDDDCKEILYEKQYEPYIDENLMDLELKINAITKIVNDEIVEKGIHLKREDKEVYIDFIKAPIGQISFNEEFEDCFVELSLDKQLKFLSLLKPEEHYYALKCFIEDLIANGLIYGLIESMNESINKIDANFEFDKDLRSRIMRGLIQIAPYASKDIIAFTLRNFYVDDPEKYKDFFLRPNDDEVKNAYIDVLKKTEYLKYELVRKDLFDELRKELLSVEEEELRNKILKKLEDVNTTIMQNIPYKYQKTDDIKAAEDKILLDIFEKKRLNDLKTPIVEELSTLRDILIDELSEDDDVETRKTIAYRENISTELLSKLAVDESYEVRKIIAMRSGLNNAIIRKLATDNDPEIRKIIVNKERLPPDIILPLAKDKNVSVRRKIASRYDLTEDMLLLLTKDPDESVRRIIAYREILSNKIIQELAKDKSKMVREIIAYREDLPDYVILDLAKDKDDYIRKINVYRRNLSEPVISKLALFKNKEIRRIIACRKGIPDRIKFVLAHDSCEEVRKTISLREDLPVKIILILAQDKSKEIRKIIDKRYKILP
ncbi:MAG: hypothetical protein EAX96_20595 [Candidatus Lokiarchaeota archaeon]|nr:hypothetical protein [Candidatus Lokiarchaeota archaeon]